MMGPETAQDLVRARVSPSRFEHSLRVAETAARLAARWGASPEAARLAGILHDQCRELTAGEMLAAAARHGIPVGRIERRRPVPLLHGPVAAAELRAAALPEDVLAAISRHTVGGAGMTVLEKCLYLADLCEPGRDFEGLDEIRALTNTDLDAALAAGVRACLLDLVHRRRAIVPEAIDLYNELHA